MSQERRGKWYYYANERGCLKHTDSIDEIGIGFEDEDVQCSLTIRLMDLSGGSTKPHFTMILVAHNDEWRALEICSDVLTLLSRNGIDSGQMGTQQPFSDLRAKIEKLGYKNLGALNSCRARA